MAEAHTLCAQLENALQDTMKEQDQSLRVTAHGDPGCATPFLFRSQRGEAEREATPCRLDLGVHLGFSGTSFLFILIAGLTAVEQAQVPLVLCLLSSSPRLVLTRQVASPWEGLSPTLPSVWLLGMHVGGAVLGSRDKAITTPSLRDSELRDSARLALGKLI